MEDRITVKLETGLEPERRSALAEAVTSAFGLTRAEAEALLAAETLVLGRHEARILAGLCRKLGIGAVVSAPPPRRARRAPWLALGAALALVPVGLFAWPRLPERVPSAITAEVVGVASSPQPAGTEPEIVPLVPGSADSVLVVPSEAEPLDAESSATESYATQAPDGEASGVSDAALSVVEAPEVEPVVPGSSGGAPPDLFAAAREGEPRLVQQALLSAPQVDLRDAYGQTPLMYAAESNSPEAARVLIASGALVDAQSDAGWTPLMYAARNLEHPEVAALLLALGADLSLRNASGQSAQDIALAYNNVAVAQTFAAHAASPDAARAEPGTATGGEPPSDPSLATAEPDAPPPGSGSDEPPSLEAAPLEPELREVVAGEVVPIAPLEDAPAATVSGRSVPSQTVPITPPILILPLPSPTPAPPVTPPSVSVTVVPDTPEDAANRDLLERCLSDWDTCGTE